MSINDSQHPAISLRTALAVLGTSTLGLASIKLAHQVLAENATPEAGSFPREGHPLAGPWAFEDGQYTTLTTSFEVDGVCFNYVADLGMGIGGWQTTGERTGAMVIVYQNFPDDLRWADLFVPGYVSTGHTFKPGVAMRRTNLEVDATGNSLTGLGTFEGYNPDGSRGVFFDNQDQKAWRLVLATGMGATPVS